MASQQDATVNETAPVTVRKDLVENVKINFEAKLASANVPIDLNRTQVVEMALKNELARQEAEIDAEEAAAAAEGESGEEGTEE